MNDIVYQTEDDITLTLDSLTTWEHTLTLDGPITLTVNDRIENRDAIELHNGATLICAGE